MSEIEAAAVDSAASFLRRKPKHALPLGSPCPNCATALQGPWCHACGQSAEDFHRSLPRLMVEALGGFFELDSRLWRTLPNLVFNPAKLTRQYLDGHRAPQAPPFRTFLIVVVLVFLVGGLVTKKDHAAVNVSVPARSGVTVTTPAGTVSTTGAAPAAKGAASPAGPSGSGQSGVVFDDEDFSFGGPTTDRSPALKWLKDRAKYANQHQDAFAAVLLAWAQRLSILTLPLSAILLGPMFFWKRRVYMFDHLIFSMHSLSFQGLLYCTIALGVKLTGAFGWLALFSPIHLFFHLRGTYQISVIGTLLRMLLLFIGSLVAIVFLALGLILIGLYEMGG